MNNTLDRSYVSVLCADYCAGFVDQSYHSERFDFSASFSNTPVSIERVDDYNAVEENGQSGLLPFRLNFTKRISIDSYAEMHKRFSLKISSGRWEAREADKLSANCVSYPSDGLQKRKFRPFSVNDQPLVSVVIPVYNRTQQLRESIKSILNQSYQNLEVILVSDNSPNETVSVLGEFESDSRVRIKYYSDRSGNACRGRNTAILMAKGNIIAFQDSDDITYPNRIKDAVYAFTQCLHGNLDLLYGTVKILYDGSRVSSELAFGQQIDSALISLDDLKSQNPMFTCTVCVRRDALLLWGPFRRQMTYREDHELWLRLASKGCSFMAMPTPLSLYRYHQDNAELTFLDRDDEWKSRMNDLYKVPFDEPWTW